MTKPPAIWDSLPRSPGGWLEEKVGTLQMGSREVVSTVHATMDTVEASLCKNNSVVSIYQQQAEDGSGADELGALYMCYAPSR